MKIIKNTLILLLLSIFLLSISNCGSSKDSSVITLENNPPFSITEIFAQDWVAGVKQGGSGTNVQITFNTIDENIVLESIYFANKVLLLKKTGQNSKVFIGSYKTSPNRDIIMDSDSAKEAKNTPEPTYPFALSSNEAVIKYSVEGASKYFKTSDVVIKPDIAYPASNRN